MIKLKAKISTNHIGKPTIIYSLLELCFRSFETAPTRLCRQTGKGAPSSCDKAVGSHPSKTNGIQEMYGSCRNLSGFALRSDGGYVLYKSFKFTFVAIVGFILLTNRLTSTFISSSESEYAGLRRPHSSLRQHFQTSSSHRKLTFKTHAELLSRIVWNNL